MDKKTGLNFLIDSGANVSVFPRMLMRNTSKFSESEQYKLFAANGTEIKTYGVQVLELDFRLRRCFKWMFIIADVRQPIIGADFLVNFKLLIDLSGRKLIDQITSLNVIACVSNSNEPTLKTVDDSHPYYELLQKFPDITKPFSFKDKIKHSVFHQIETSGAPVHARARPLPPDRYVKAKKEFQIMQELGICRPSKSAWASPLHIVPKKDGNIRPCGDYRMLNAITKPDRYPVPRLQNFTYVLAGKKIYSRLDVNRAFNCIPVLEADVEKTAVITPFGLWEFNKMPFGLRNSAQTFQRFMDNSVLQGLEYIFAYIDDVIVASDDIISHKRHLEEVFRRFDEFGITINIAKCCFGQAKLDFLGFEVSTDGIKPLDHKVQAIVNFPRPTTVEELRRYLGMLNFYRSHIPHAAEQQAEMNKYLHNSKRKDKTKIEWTEKAEEEFKQTKVSLQNAILLSHPSTDSPLTLMTDASDTSVGASIQQKEGNVWKPLGFFSKRLSETQKKYSTYDRELLAIYLAIVHFRYLIEGREIVVLTDHKPLTYAFSKIGSDKETPRRARQIMFISEFTTQIKYVAGKENTVADCLSRIETISCPTVIDFSELAVTQETDEQLAGLVSESNNNNKFHFKRIILPGTENSIVCEMSTERARPYLTKQFRRVAFDTVHNLSHPGIRTTRQLVCDRYFWVGMNKDVNLWAKACLRCQRSKVLKHTVSDLGQFQTADRFQHVHIDIIGPLPTTSDGYRYCVTMIDRFTRWAEAIPTKDITADTVAKVLYEGWITRFGCPEKLTSDQGRQFESNLFKQLMVILGIYRIRSSPYHPQSNGKLERWHRTLKSALMARLNSTSWIDELATVMLGLRAATRVDTGVSAAELTYGTTIRLPGDFYNAQSQNVQIDQESYVHRLRQVINSYTPVSRVNRDSRKIFIHKDLVDCQSVFVRNDMVRRSLQHPYDGPYRVISRTDKVFKVQINDRQVNISIDRLKPAYMLEDSEPSKQAPTYSAVTKASLVDKEKMCGNRTHDMSHSTTKDSEHRTRDLSDKLPRTTRSGRVIKLPVRFRL